MEKGEPPAAEGTGVGFNIKGLAAFKKKWEKGFLTAALNKCSADLLPEQTPCSEPKERKNAVQTSHSLENLRDLQLNSKWQRTQTF